MWSGNKDCANAFWDQSPVLYFVDTVQPVYAMTNIHAKPFSDMYRFFALFALFLLPLAVEAQHGTVHYEHTVTSTFNLPDQIGEMKIVGMEEALAKMPKHHTVREILLFDTSASLLTVTEDDDEQRFASTVVKTDAGMEIRMTVTRAGSGLREKINATYVDLDNGTFTQVRSLRGREFLVSGEQVPLSWRLPGEEATVLDYHVLKATAMQDSVTIEAWYAPEIPFPGGPELYGGLPGMILMLSIDNGKETYTAVEIDLENAPEFEAPDKGRAVTLEEYEQIRNDKLKELEQRRPEREVRIFRSGGS